MISLRCSRDDRGRCGNGGSSRIGREGAGSNFIARAEYLHYDFGERTYNVNVDIFNANNSIDVVRGGLSYKF